MDTKEIKINCPEGFEVDKKNSTFECIKFKPIENKLPKTWEEYCNNTRRKVGEAWINEDSVINTVDSIIAKYTKSPEKDKNLLPSKELAEAILALCQLIQLRDCYNDGWKPDWRNFNEDKYSIVSYVDSIGTDCVWTTSRILTFETAKLRNEFLENFKDLIEIAKPLL